MITPHVRPDTDTYRFTVTQITLASETFPAGADHCVTEPYRDAAPGRRTRAPVRPRPAGRPRSMSPRVHSPSGGRRGSASVRPAGQKCLDDPGERRFGLPAGQTRRQPGLGPGTRRPQLPHTPVPVAGFPVIDGGCADFSAGRCHESADLSVHPPDRRPQGLSGAAPVGARRYPSTLVSIRRHRQHPPVAGHLSGSSGRRTAGPSGRLRSIHRRPRPRKNRLTRPGRPEARRCEAPRNGVLAERPVDVGTEVSGIQ